MTGYAIDVSMYQWKCKCRRHENGVCHNPNSTTRAEISSAYIGSFGFGIRTKIEAIKKWSKLNVSEALSR